MNALPSHCRTTATDCYPQSSAAFDNTWDAITAMTPNGGLKTAFLAVTRLARSF